MENLPQKQESFEVESWYIASGTEAILEEYCMASADIEWLFHSGEQVMAHGPLVNMLEL